MITEAYAYFESHRDKKLEVVRNYFTPPWAQQVLRVLELVGAGALSHFYLRWQFKKIIPGLNEERIRHIYCATIPEDTVTHKREQNERFHFIKAYGNLTHEKVLWDPKMVTQQQWVSDLALLFDLQKDLAPGGWLTPFTDETTKVLLQGDPRDNPYLSRYVSTYNKLRGLRNETTDKAAFQEMALIALGKKGFTDFDFEELQNLLRWFKEGFLNSEPTLERIQFLKQRDQLLNTARWMEDYLTYETRLQISGTNKLTSEGVRELERGDGLLKIWETSTLSPVEFRVILDYVLPGQKLLQMNDEKLALLQKLVHWKNHQILSLEASRGYEKETIALYHKIEKKYGEARLITFTRNFYRHDFYLKSDLPDFPARVADIERALESMALEEVFDHPDIKRHLRKANFFIYFNELQSDFGVQSVHRFIALLSSDSREFKKPFQDDPAYTQIQTALVQLKQLRDELVVSEADMGQFKLTLATALSGDLILPLSTDFFVRLTNQFLGSEYNTTREVILKERKEIKFDELPLIDRLRLSIPYSRHLPKKKALFNLWCHKRASLAAQEQHYAYNNWLKLVIDGLVEQLDLQSSSSLEKSFPHVERVITSGLQDLLKGTLSDTELLDLWRTENLTLIKLQDQQAHKWFEGFESARRRVTEANEISKLDPVIFDDLRVRLYLKAFHPFLRVMIPAEDNATLAELDLNFNEVDANFNNGYTFAHALKLLRERPQSRSNLIFPIIDKLHKGTLDVLSDEIIEEFARIKESLNRLVFDLNTQPFSKVIKMDWWDRFPEALFLPALTGFLSDFEKSRLKQPQTGLAALLQKIPRLVEGLTWIEIFKKGGPFADFVIKNLGPVVLDLFVGFFSEKKSKALSNLICLLVPYIMKNHDFEKLKEYLVFLKDYPSDKLTDEMKAEITQRTCRIVNWFIDQILKYQRHMTYMLEALKKELPVIAESRSEVPA